MVIAYVVMAYMIIACIVMVYIVMAVMVYVECSSGQVTDSKNKTIRDDR